MAWESVTDNYADFTSKFEGKLPFMYLDVKGLVTTGIGNLIDSVGAAQALPWINSDGSPASAGQVADAWNAVKARQDMKLRGGGAFSGVTSIRLTDDGISQLVNQKNASNENTLRKSFPNYDNWPADAQLGLLSMAWAMGPNFAKSYPKFTAAVNQIAPDFAAASQQAYMNDTANPGLKPRNAANENLFLAANDTLKNNLDVSQINWSGFQDLLASGVRSIVAAGTGAATAVVKTQRKFLVPSLIGGGLLTSALLWFNRKPSKK